MADVLEWKRATAVVIDELCALWGLPRLPPRRFPVAEDREKPPPHWPSHEFKHEKDSQWDSGRQRFVSIVDSQRVQQVICGHASLTNDAYRPVVRRMMSRLVSLLDIGIFPPTDISDPVQWRPREYNIRADWLCNQALDSRSSYSFLDENVDAYRTNETQWETFPD